jgi:asparagine synthase (glutamine-hydrolysing)
MEYQITLRPDSIDATIGGEEDLTSGHVTIHGRNISQDKLKELLDAYRGNNLVSAVKNLELNKFLLLLIDDQKESVEVFNDHFASNEILFRYSDKERRLTISNQADLLFDRGVQASDLNPNTFYEFFHLYYISPPRTIYQDVKSVPIGSYLSANSSDLEPSVKQYWSMAEGFHPKRDDYDQLVDDLRSELEKTLLAELDGKPALALSGGVDSGGLLGQLKELSDRSVEALTVGPYGTESGSLIDSRKTVDEINVHHEEICPERSDLKKLADFFEGINQPLNAPVVFTSGVINERARERSIDSVFTGFGAGMILGIQKENRLAYWLNKFEWLLPDALRKPLYRAVADLLNYSQTRKDVLCADSWAERHLHINSPLKLHDRFYTFDSAGCLEPVKELLEEVFSKDELNIVDQFMLADWNVRHIYEQMTALHQIARQFNVNQMNPFYTPRIASVILRTPNKFRKLNKWDKKIIRDLFKPFISERLYEKQTKAVIYPADNWFRDEFAERVFDYLESSPPIKKFVDIPKLRHEWQEFKEPGYSLFRLLGFAVWYDVNWNTQNLDNFHRIFHAS